VPNHPGSLQGFVAFSCSDIMAAMRTLRLTHVLALLITLTAPVFAQDIRNSQDHPLITRYPGQKIINFDTKEFDRYNLVLSVDKTGAPEKIKPLEGKVTRIMYGNPAGRSTLELFRNFEGALKQASAQILFTCEGTDCGTPIRWQRINGIRSMGGQIHNRYVAGKLMKSGAEVYVSIFIGGQFTQLDVVELKPMESGLVVVDSDALERDIEREGHVAVYAILFDTGQSRIKPESSSVLNEIGKLMKRRSDLRLYVVGHTDSTGSFEANMQLSQDRAAAVVQSLVSQHGIAISRLKGNGVGPLAPVASNATEDGKSRNRRVELVAQ
ncbi:MAG TPA: DUF4892 domain-containing protein, partial [Blastocatellia bacterium]|nr:DUF4892 domain-containing protein [Blastocatellia bacterium]